MRRLESAEEEGDDWPFEWPATGPPTTQGQQSKILTVIVGLMVNVRHCVTSSLASLLTWGETSLRSNPIQELSRIHGWRRHKMGRVTYNEMQMTKVDEECKTDFFFLKPSSFYPGRHN